MLSSPSTEAARSTGPVCIDRTAVGRGADERREAAAGSAPGLSAAVFQRFARFIKDELGIKMPDTKRTMMQSRLLRRVRDLRMESLDQYAEYFFSSANALEREYFINAITTNKTDFFREADQFDYLVRVALPQIRRPDFADGARFKVWSAGCSTGEEPYTLAMVLSEYAETRAGFDFVVLGTDVSTRVLERARSGIYPESQIAPVAPELRRKYLLSSRDGGERLTRVAPALRAKTTFHPLNFMDDDYGIRQTMDAVFFRNVMIYFDKPTQEAVIGKICRHLAPGGYLFAGRSESLFGLDIPLTQVAASVYRRKS